MISHREKGSSWIIYWVACLSNPVYVKVGCSRNPFDRISELQIGCPFELKLISLEYGGKDRESQIHRGNSDAHVRGEWFLSSIEFCNEMIPKIRGGVLLDAISRRRESRLLAAKEVKEYLQNNDPDDQDEFDDGLVPEPEVILAYLEGTL